jgi:hypothetical protein
MTQETADDRPAAIAPTLGELDSIELTPHLESMLQLALVNCGGDAATRNCKQAQARLLLALAQIVPAGRLQVEWLDLRNDLRALLRLGVPVACRPNAQNELQTVWGAVLGFTYPTEAFHKPLPGHAFFQILRPRNVWLAQVRQPDQALCIAAQIPAGTRAALLVLRAYGALSMQSIQTDVADPAGVFDADIAGWWQHNLHRVPLTRTSLLEPTDRS